MQVVRERANATVDSMYGGSSSCRVVRFVSVQDFVLSALVGISIHFFTFKGSFTPNLQVIQRDGWTSWSFSWSFFTDWTPSTFPLCIFESTFKNLLDYLVTRLKSYYWSGSVSTRQIEGAQWSAGNKGRFTRANMVVTWINILANRHVGESKWPGA